jgi:hypothetical protein
MRNHILQSVAVILQSTTLQAAGPRDLDSTAEVKAQLSKVEVKFVQ